MLTALTSQLSHTQRKTADRSIAATAGALFGIVVASAAGLMAGRPPFSLDSSLLMAYGSAIPLGVAGFMSYFSKEAPRLPMLATLQFLAIFVPGLYFMEVLFSGDNLQIAGMWARDFVGFRAIVVAALSGVLFSAIKPDGTVGSSKSILEQQESRVDWEKRHAEAVRRLAMVDVDLRQQRSHEEGELDAFERRLRAAMVADEEWTLDVEEAVEFSAAPAYAA